MMKKHLILMVTAAAALTVSEALSGAQEFNRLPYFCKWVSSDEAVFSYDGSYTDDEAFLVAFPSHAVEKGVKSPEKFRDFPLKPEGAVNLTFSPDSSMLAFNRGNDLYVIDIATEKETRLTFDGSELILNGYSSWVYFEEVFGRPANYRSFWWSPDSRKIGFYRYDNTEVPMFPIYSPFGQDGKLHQTRYPKAGEPNPKVRIGIADLDRPGAGIVWADFDENEDQYFGIPFWGADSREFFIAREPRIQNTLDLYSVSASDGSRKHIYHEEYKTWLDWIDGMLFSSDGLYMARSFETGWQQIYYLSYDGNVLKRLTDGKNWRVSLVDVKEGKAAQGFDGSTSEILFVAERDSRVRSGLYSVCRGEVKNVSDPSLHVKAVRVSPDMKYAAASVSNSRTPSQVWIYDLAKPAKSFKVADMAGAGFNAADYALPEVITMTTKDGLELPAMIVYPENFDKSKKYPVYMYIYGGPDTPQVVDNFRSPRNFEWYAKNGIIEIIADCRASGHNGREGLDQIYKRLDEREVLDFVEWAEYLKTLPYVNGDKIGVEGFSFGGTMTALLLMNHSDAFHYGIAGGGVYDWNLYDTHYTERFMDTPANNPDGYAETSVLASAANYPVTEANYDGSVMLKLTHGTGDDNVHFQSTLQLVDALQKAGKKFELMIYPDGMHGYRGYQGAHFNEANRAFWLHYLCGK